ncbi:MAG: hypothetical protein ACK559_16840, partial [bacterium]
MRRLVLLVHRARAVDVRQLVEGEHAVELGRLHPRLRDGARRRVVGVALATRHEAASAGDHLHARVEHAGEEALVEGLAPVAHLPQFLLGPRALDQRGVAREPRVGAVAGGHG